jgi:hypothetical protein
VTALNSKTTDSHECDLLIGAPVAVLQQCQSSNSRLRWWIAVIGSLFFVAASKTYVLYWSNQNTKFLHGLARAFPDRLGADWTAHTTDGLPLFSNLVFVVARYFHPVVFYLIEAMLLACFFCSCLFIATRIRREKNSPVRYQLTVAAILIFLVHLNGVLHLGDGMAGQYMLGGYLQASEFGVLFVVAIALALGGFNSAALIAAAIPAAFHPGYAFISVLMTGCLVGSSLDRRLLFLGAALAAVALILVPQINLLLRFSPTSVQSFEEAARILAFKRIPYHSIPSIWIGSDASIKLAISVLGILLAPRGLLRTTLGVLLAWVVLGTLAVAVTGSAKLGLIAPWRASIVVVPVSLTIIVARLAAAFVALTDAAHLRVIATSVMVLIAFITAGKGMSVKAKDYRARELPAYIEFIRGNHQPGDVYLTSPSDETFRLEAMAAQFVSWKTHPYLDVDVLEWNRRVTLARRVFGSPEKGTSMNCVALSALIDLYPVSHVLLKRHTEKAFCPFLEPLFYQDGVRIFRVDRAR